jgi:radical SAM protein with 4Fe4S-binding SPASM domain
MSIHTILQISELDNQWGFEPDWIIEHDHLKDLVTQFKNVEREIDIHVLTSNQDEDNKIKTHLKDLPVSVKRVGPDKYCSTALVKHLKTFSGEDLILLPSAYLAYFPEEVLKFAIRKMEKIDVEFIRFLTGYRQFMPTIARNESLINTLETSWDNYNKAGTSDPDYRLGWEIKPGLPFWIFPARLVNPLLRDYKNNNFGLTKTKLSEENIHINTHHIQKLKFYIDSSSSAKLWRQLKDSEATDIDSLHDKFEKLFPVQSEFPPAIVADLNCDRTMDFSAPRQLDALISPDQLIQTINTAGQSSPFFLTYLQLGHYYDPLETPDFIDVLESIDKRHFQIGLHTGSSELKSKVARAIIDQLDELFFHFGPPVLNQKNRYQGSAKQSEKYELLWQEKLNKYKKGKRNGPVNPTVSAVFHFEQSEPPPDFIQLKKLWTTYKEKRNELREKNKFDWEDFLTNFYGAECCADHLILQLDPTKSSQFAPLERKPCRQITESLYLSPDGNVYPCNQVAGQEEYKLNNAAKQNDLLECWTSQKRVTYVKDHQKEKYTIIKPCIDCDFWYQPVL